MVTQLFSSATFALQHLLVDGQSQLNERPFMDIISSFELALKRFAKDHEQGSKVQQLFGRTECEGEPVGSTSNTRWWCRSRSGSEVVLPVHRTVWQRTGRTNRINALVMCSCWRG